VKPPLPLASKSLEGKEVTRIHYNRQEHKKAPYSGDGKQNTFKPNGPFCPLSNIRLGVNDPRATTFLVNGQAVLVNYDAFINRCRTAGWIIPKISAGDTLDVEIWLMSVATKFVDLTADIETQKQLEKIRVFADTIGVKNFTSKLKRACHI
jgi:hypothetical protein